MLISLLSLKQNSHNSNPKYTNKTNPNNKLLKKRTTYFDIKSPTNNTFFYNCFYIQLPLKSCNFSGS